MAGQLRTPPDTRPILLSIVLCTLLHLANISIIAAMLCLAMWGYHLLALIRGLPAPGLVVKTVGGLLLFLVAVLTNDGLTVEAFVALLVLMISLKLFELRHQRDAMITVILCYFVIVSGMFFSDSLLATIYIATIVLYNTAVLVHVRHPGIDMVPAIRLAGRLVLWALPLTVVLFLVFPRIQGGLWGRPSLIAAQSGFTEEIAFGSIAELATNDDVAFRVTFAGPLPAPENLYWRGIVLSQFDGQAWRREDGRGGLAKSWTAGNTSISYTLTLEPHHRQWLFALDLPTRVLLRGTWLSADHTIAAWRPVTSRISYQASSRMGAQPEAREDEYNQALQLPEGGNSRARQLATQWRRESSSDAEIIDRALAYFRSGNFRYTLNPGWSVAGTSAARDAIDQFLFTNRTGFCEHFAASFVFLLRAAGLPARLVGGYLGGQVNPYGGYLVVRQSDAHAWSEVLLDGSWQRIDPTTLVAPLRLQARAADFFAEGEGDAFSLLGLTRLPKWLQPLGDGWDLLNSRWNLWVMQYSFASQTRLFSRIGIDLSISKGLVQAVFFGVVLLGASYFLLIALQRGNSPQFDPVAREWRRFCATMARLGIPRKSHQGPIAYLEAIENRRPDLAGPARQVIDRYIAIRYNRQADPATLAAFQDAVRALAQQRRKSDTAQ
jgi:transglutaminase-like putative cysteine protease